LKMLPSTSMWFPFLNWLVLSTCAAFRRSPLHASPNSLAAERAA
jgi:hypothetical protein